VSKEINLKKNKNCSNGLPASPESLWQNVTAGADSRTGRLSGLRPATAYLMRVIAANEVGLGAPSHPPLLALTTQEGEFYIFLPLLFSFFLFSSRRAEKLKQFVSSAEWTTCRRLRRVQLARQPPSQMEGERQSQFILSSCQLAFFTARLAPICFHSLANTLLCFPLPTCLFLLKYVTFWIF